MKSYLLNLKVVYTYFKILWYCWIPLSAPHTRLPLPSLLSCWTVHFIYIIHFHSFLNMILGVSEQGSWLYCQLFWPVHDFIRTFFSENWQKHPGHKTTRHCMQMCLVCVLHPASWHLFGFSSSVSWDQWIPGSNLISLGALGSALCFKGDGVLEKKHEKTYWFASFNIHFLPSWRRRQVSLKLVDFAFPNNLLFLFCPWAFSRWCILSSLTMLSPTVTTASIS